MKIIRVFEKLILLLILGLVAPILGALIFWFGADLCLPEQYVPWFALSGLLLGVVLDLVLLKRIARNAYRLDYRFWVALYLFYTIGIFGMFMGVPVVNALLAIPAGFVVGGKLSAENSDFPGVRRTAIRTAWFTTTVLTLICIASAVIALLDPYTAGNLQGMFGLKFPVTSSMIYALILVGGVFLLAFNWILTVISVRFSFTFLQRK